MVGDLLIAQDLANIPDEMATPNSPVTANRLPAVQVSLLETPGPKWHNNSCAVDTILWAAKIVKLGQLECDVGAEGQGELQREALRVLRSDWKDVGKTKLAAWRDKLLKGYAEAGAKRVGQNQGAQGFWETIAMATPSTTFCMAQAIKCKCGTRLAKDQTHTTILGQYSGMEIRLPSDRPATMSEILQEHFSTYSAGVNCVGCGTLKARSTRLRDRLPAVLYLWGAVDWHAILKDETVRFRYYTTASRRIEVEYVPRVVVLYEPELSHFVAMAQDWKDGGRTGGSFYDGMEAGGLPTTLDAPGVARRLRRAKGAGNIVNAVILERV